MTISGRSEDDLPLAAYSRRGTANQDDDVSEPLAPVANAAPPYLTAPSAPHRTMTLDALDEPMAPAPTDAGPPTRRLGAGLDRARVIARRNPRLAAGAGFVAVIAVGLMLLGGSSPAPSAAGVLATAGTPTVPPAVADPGAASLVLTGSVEATLSFTGSAPSPVAANVVSAAWADQLENVLTLDGPVDRGTRTTDAGLVLTLGLMVDGKLVTFTSQAGECTIGMASSPKAVSGSFACPKLTSDDGKLTVGATGTYRT
jgi:hypothetical protein